MTRRNILLIALILPLFATAENHLSGTVETETESVGNTLESAYTAPSLTLPTLSAAPTLSSLTDYSMAYASRDRERSRGSVSQRRRMQRVDRGIMNSTFIPKGQWMMGGTISYSEYDGSNINFLVLKDVDGLGYTFRVSPYLGYFFRKNMAVGLRYTYSRTYMDLGNLDLNLGEDFNISLKDLYWLEHQYEGTVFLRTYMPIGKSKIFGFFNEVRLTYGYSEGKNSTGSGTEYDGTYERAHMAQIGFAPGLTAFVLDFAAVEVSMGVMGYNMKWVEQVTNQVETGSRRDTSGSFKINLFSINIGLTLYL